jgi:hypothetical protein
MKKLNDLLTLIVATTLMASVLAIILIHINLFDGKQYGFSFTVSGIEFYLNQFGEHKGLFTLTIASVAALAGLKSLGESTKANQERIKQDRFMEWKNALEKRVDEIIEKDPYMDRIFIQHRYQLFTILYGMDFNVKNHSQLVEIFEVFKNATDFLESQSKWHMKLGGIYRDDHHAYAYDSFRFVLYGGIFKEYVDAERDLNKLYLDSLPKHRIIDQKLYESTLADKRWPTVV